MEYLLIALFVLLWIALFVQYGRLFKPSTRDAGKSQVYLTFFGAFFMTGLLYELNSETALYFSLALTAVWLILLFKK